MLSKITQTRCSHTRQRRTQFNWQLRSVQVSWPWFRCWRWHVAWLAVNRRVAYFCRKWHCIVSRCIIRESWNTDSRAATTYRQPDTCRRGARSWENGETVTHSRCQLYWDYGV